MAGWRFIDDLITGLGRQSMPRPRNVFYVDPQGVARTESQDFLQRMAELAQAEDLVRGSTMALRARNAERGFLDQLGDADLPAGRQFTPRDVARLRTDEARRDARMGPFAPDDLNANAWDWRRTVERNLAEARAAQIASDQYRNQLGGAAAGAVPFAAALGTAAATSQVAGNKRPATTAAPSQPSPQTSDFPGAVSIFPPDNFEVSPPQSRRMFGDDLPSNTDALAEVLRDDPDTGSLADAGLFANLPAIAQGQEPQMTPSRNASLEELYRIRMSLPDDQRAQVEQEYEAYLAAKQPQRASPTSLDPVEAAAMDIPDDPEPMDSVRAGLFANLPERQMGALDAEVPTPPLEDDGISEEEVDARVRMVQQRGASNMFTPETQRAVARAALEYPVDPMSGDYSTPQFRAAVREAIARENQARAAAKAQAEAEANAPYEADARQRANIQRLIRAGVNPMQDMTAPTAEQQDKFDNWARSGSMERMARYAPGEFARRQEIAAEGYRQDARAELARRNDATIDPETGRPLGELYKEKQKDKTLNQLRQTEVMANRKLYRELAAMGIDPTQFGDPQSTFDRKLALQAKTRANYSGTIGTDNDGNAIPVGGRAGAVQRRAQLQQNPMEYLGRPDVTEDQRMQASFGMSGGRGATPNDVRALNQKMVLEGIQQGARANMNIGNKDMAQQLALFQMQQQNFDAAQKAAQDFFDRRAKGLMSKSLDAESYDDLIALLGAYNLTPAQADGIARRYRRAPTRAEKTQPKEG